MWESAKLVLGCLVECQRQSKGGIKIDGRKAKHGRAEMKRDQRGHLCAVQLLSRLSLVPDHHSVFYLHVKLLCVYDLVTNFKPG